VKKFLVILGSLSLVGGSVVRGQDKAGHAGDMDHVVVRPSAIKWGPAPPSLPPGSQIAVLNDRARGLSQERGESGPGLVPRSRS
jgi:hypothetical protein